MKLIIIKDLEVSTNDHKTLCLDNVVLQAENCNGYYDVFAVTTAFKQASQILSREFSAEAILSNIPSFANHVIAWCESRAMLVGNVSVAAQRCVV